MKLTKIETLRLTTNANLILLRLHTDEGITGLGETFFLSQTVETYLHEYVAPRILGRNPLALEAIASSLKHYLGMRSSGVEMRGNSAVDLALWDILGKVTNQPVAQLLGGFTRPAIRTYNTCAGHHYMRKEHSQTSTNYDLSPQRRWEYDDLNAFMTRADELACALLEEGITAMKIWPFDLAAEKTGGQEISADDLRQALKPLDKIRNAVGDRMEIMVEFHSLWKLAPAMKIAQALAPYQTTWHEDPICLDYLAQLKRYAEVTPAPICASETLAGCGSFLDLLRLDAVGIVMLDLSWCGGLTVARKIAAMAEAWQLPIAPHDCTGPVVLTASTHLSLAAPNAIIQESVRAFLRTWYRDLVTQLPQVTNGMITVPPGPGFGLELLPDLEKNPDVIRRSSDA